MIRLSQIFFLFLAVASVGCASSENPVIPDDSDQFLESENSTLSRIPAKSHHFLWSYHLIYIDPATLDFEITPVRLTQTHWNVLSWLENGPCTDCFKLVKIQQSGNGNILADVQITHPFSNKNLTGFDIRGIAMFDGSMNFPGMGLTASDASLGDGELVNADGYTTLYNSETAGSGPGGLQGYLKGKFATPTPPNATLNGYKRFVTDDPLNTRNTFYSGSSTTVTFEIDMPDSQFVFGYAVDASWAPPIKSPVEDPMTDFGPNANCPEPWRIDVVSTAIGDGLTECGGTAVLDIHVYDWQGADNVYPVQVEVPGIFSGIKTADLIEDTPTFSTYSLSIGNEEFAPAGEYRALISKEAAENDTAPEWLDLTAYQVYVVNVAPFEDAVPTALAEASQLSVFNTDTVLFDGSMSYDNDCDGESIISWEWDWENDGEFDVSGAQAEHIFYSEGTYEVQMRVTDDEGSSDTLDKPIIIPVVLTNDSGWVSVQDWVQWNCELDYDDDGFIYTVGIGQNVRTSLLKVDTFGNPVWSFSMDGNGIAIGDGICLDSDGDVYIAGMINAKIDFDPGPGEEIHDAGTDGTDSFIAKYDADGNYLWAHTFGSIHYGDRYWYTRAHAIQTNQFGDLFVSGTFRLTMDFDPGPGVEEHTATGGENGGLDAYVSAFNTDGEFQWVRTWGSDDNGEVDSGDNARGLDIDSNGDVYVTGGFHGTVDFDPGPGVDEKTSTDEFGDFYLLKWDRTGDYQWVRTWAAHGYANYPSPYPPQGWGGKYLHIDDMNNIYIVGEFKGPLDFDPGAGEFIRGDGQGAFLTIFDIDGNLKNAVTWDNPGESLDLMFYGVYTDLAPNIYITGTFTNDIVVDLDPGPGITPHQGAGYNNSLLVKLNSEGDFIWSRSWSPTSGFNGWTVARCLTTDLNNDVYLGGDFRDEVDFDPGPGIKLEDSSGVGFLLKIKEYGYW